jgi:hypothetical protein
VLHPLSVVPTTTASAWPFEAVPLTPKGDTPSSSPLPRPRTAK